MVKVNKMILSKGWRCICLRVRLTYIRLQHCFKTIFANTPSRVCPSSYIMKSKDDKKWMVNKGYIHLDTPFTPKQKPWLYRYITNKDAIVHHAFLPLMRRTVKTYPFKHNEEGVRKKKKKIRKLTFASHIDAAIFAYYAEKLQADYEKYIKGIGIDDVVTAYRKIKSESHKGNKCNIDFAYDVFSYIKKNLTEDNPMDVVTFDIKGFFDNLNPGILKEKWKKIIGKEHLDDDEYAIFKHVTNYSYVNETEIFRLFKDRIICKTKKGEFVKRKIKHTNYLRDKNAIAYCMKKDIAEIREKGLIRCKKEANGIPQGLPISSTLANVYMIDFDKDIKSFVDENKGIYRRYSDDIIVVCPKEVSAKIKDLIMHKIGDVSLTIEQSKTNLYHFTKKDKEVNCQHEELGSNDILKYLGFSFDGNHILLRNSSVCKFYYKMHKSVKRSVYFAIHINNKTRGEMFEHHLISRFTYAGANRHPIYRRSNKKKTFYHIKGQKSYGNFLTYAEKASRIMNEPKIKGQLRRCTGKLRKSISKGHIDIGEGIYDLVVRQVNRYGKLYI